MTTWTSANTKDAAWWDYIGRPQDPAAILHKEDWYAKLGFVKWKTERRYPYTNKVTGQSLMLDIAVSRVVGEGGVELC